MLVGGFNNLEKYQSDWIIIPTIGENKKCSKPPTSNVYDKPWPVISDVV